MLEGCPFKDNATLELLVQRVKMHLQAIDSSGFVVQEDGLPDSSQVVDSL